LCCASKIRFQQGNVILTTCRIADVPQTVFSHAELWHSLWRWISVAHAWHATRISESCANNKRQLKIKISRMLCSLYNVFCSSHLSRCPVSILLNRQIWFLEWRLHTTSVLSGVSCSVLLVDRITIAHGVALSLC